MIIGTYADIEVGKIYTRIIDRVGPDQITINQPFMVMREASFEEYKEYHESMGVTLPVGSPPKDSKFYLVSID